MRRAPHELPRCPRHLRFGFRRRPVQLLTAQGSQRHRCPSALYHPLIRRGSFPWLSFPPMRPLSSLITSSVRLLAASSRARVTASYFRSCSEPRATFRPSEQPIGHLHETQLRLVLSVPCCPPINGVSGYSSAAFFSSQSAALKDLHPEVLGSRESVRSLPNATAKPSSSR